MGMASWSILRSGGVIVTLAEWGCTWEMGRVMQALSRRVDASGKISMTMQAQSKLHRSQLPSPTHIDTVDDRLVIRNRASL